MIAHSLVIPHLGNSKFTQNSFLCMNTYIQWVIIVCLRPWRHSSCQAKSVYKNIKSLSEPCHWKAKEDEQNKSYCLNNMKTKQVRSNFRLPPMGKHYTSWYAGIWYLKYGNNWWRCACHRCCATRGCVSCCRGSEHLAWTNYIPTYFEQYTICIRESEIVLLFDSILSSTSLFIT